MINSKFNYKQAQISMDNSKSSFLSQNKSYHLHKQQMSSIFTDEVPMRLKSNSSYQSLQENHDNNNPINVLQTLHQEIHMKMIQLDKLNGEYFYKQEKLFFKTFINIMDRMSNQLAETNEKFDNIDQEIDQETQCVQLRSKLTFFRDESLIMKIELENMEKQLANIRAKNQQKQTKNRALFCKLTTQAKKQQKYKQRKYSLETKLQDFDLQLIGVKRTNKTSAKNRCGSSYSHRNVISDLEQMKSTKNPLRRPMTAYQLESGSSKTLENKNQHIANIKVHKTSGQIHRPDNRANLNSLKCSLPLASQRLSNRISPKNNYF